MFVYNGEEYLRSSLDSVLGQTFGDFELIVSDNASTDRTEAICREYAAADSRIVYIRQPTNLGGVGNMKFVFDQARGEFFMWMACDDRHSPDFLQLNHQFLVSNPEYVASTCPTGFEGQDPAVAKLIDFALDGDPFDRFETFFRHCWVSHGIFYSLVRTETLRGCAIVGDFFLAIDWAIDLYLASKGKIHRTAGGYSIFGTKGYSRGNNVYKATRVSAIEYFWPFYRLGRYCGTITGGFTPGEKLKLAAILFKLNLVANHGRLRATLEAARARRAAAIKAAPGTREANANRQ